MNGRVVKRILLVEDNPGDARLVAEMIKDLDGQRVELTHVDTVGAALTYLAAHPNDTDLVLLDLSLPDETGLDTVRRVLASKPSAGVVVMTGLGDDAVGDEAVAVGAQDYLVKSQVNAAVLKRALKFAMRRQNKQVRLQEQLLTDELTGLNNRRGFLIHAEQYARLARRNQASVVLLFIDVDAFKDINDRYGHAAGDRALKATARVLTASLRDSDVKGRIGGDEFVALALSTSESGDSDLRERLETALKDINGQRDLPFFLSFSVGLFRSPAGQELAIEDLLRRADAAMYAEKRRKKIGTPFS